MHSVVRLKFLKYAWFMTRLWKSIFSFKIKTLEIMILYLEKLGEKP